MQLVSFAARDRTVDGVDGAARGCDFRFDLHGARNAPAGEDAHGIVVVPYWTEPIPSPMLMVAGKV